MKSVLLKAEGVAKSYDGVPALKNGVLELKAGSVHALCGGNGAGKSTFLGILTGAHGCAHYRHNQQWPRSIGRQLILPAGG